MDVLIKSKGGKFYLQEENRWTDIPSEASIYPGTKSILASLLIFCGSLTGAVDIEVITIQGVSLFDNYGEEKEGTKYIS